MLKREGGQILTFREEYAKAALGILQAWVGFIIVIVLAQITLRTMGKGLEAEEFIAVVSTSTVAVLTMAWIIARFLFPQGGGKITRAANEQPISG